MTIDKFISFLLKYPRRNLLFFLPFLIWAALIVPKIQTDNSVDVFFNKKSQSYIDFDHWKKQFGSDQITMVAFKDKNIFTEENLKIIQQLTETFEMIPSVDNVTSLTTVNDIIGSNQDFIIEPLVEYIPETFQELNELRHQALSNPLYVKNIISEDGTTAAIIIELEKQGEGESQKKILVDKILEILDSEPYHNKKFHIGGLTPIEVFYVDYMTEDLGLFMPLMLGLILIILYLSLRTLRGTLLSFLVILISLMMTMTLIYLFGFSVNNVTTIIPPIILAIAIADNIHIILESLQLKKTMSAEGITSKKILHQTLKDLLFPCFLTSITTSAGFLSLTVSSIAPVRELGFVVSLGVIFAFILSFVILPPLLIESGCLEKKYKNKKPPILLNNFLKHLAQFNERFKNLILSLAVLLVLFSIWGCSKIIVETRMIEYFKHNTPIYESTAFIEKNLSGVDFLHISLKTNQRDSFKNPSILNEIDELQRFLLTIKGVNKITSIIDYIKEIHKSFHNENEQYYAIPESKALISQYMLLYGDDDLNDFVNTEWDWTTIRVRMTEPSTKIMTQVIDQIDAYLEKSFKDHVEYNIVGQTVLTVEANESVTKGQIKSLILAFIIIFAMMFIVFRSLSVGIISIIPNIFIILVNFGIMGFLGIRLDSATSMISAVGIGIIIDDTIHFLQTFGDQIAIKNNYTLAMHNTLLIKGGPIILTSVILACGFGVLSFSRFIPTAYFGILSSIMMINALLADLIILPCILITLKPKFKKIIYNN